MSASRGTHVAHMRGMTVKSKARRVRRANQESASPKKHVPVTAEEKRAAGAIMGALLDAITLGTLEPAPQSRV